MFGRRKKQSEVDPAAGAEVFSGLRARALELEPSTVGLAPTEELPRVFGVVMDMALDNGVATLVAFADGTTSLYTSTGGGVIGAGGHDNVVTATRRLLLVAEARLDDLVQDADLSVPGPGLVALTVLTYTGRSRAIATGDDFARGAHAASDVFNSAQEVLHQVHVVEAAARGASDELEIPGGATPLMAAAHAGNVGAATQLIEQGAKVEAKDDSGYTALMYASNAGHEDVVELLLERGANPNAADRQNSTPLMFAAQHDHLGIVRQLLSAGAEVNARGDHGFTALGLAQQNGHERTIAVLVTAGAT
ncbi:MAG: ankyrin repeat domain-containing protein [Acidimicrobiia bacterium]